MSPGREERIVTEPMHRAIFLDRDGVLVHDDHLITAPEQLRVMEGAPMALERLRAAGWRLVVVTNQTVVARGLLDEAGVGALHEDLRQKILAGGGPSLDAFYVCPHHPRADDPRYRVDCDCRKPRPGLLLRAAAERNLDLSRSFLVGDRPSDIAAGQRAGCRTILVTTGRHEDPPIQSPDSAEPTRPPDAVLPDLAAAVDWILGEERP